MKFTDGQWLTKPKHDFLYATQVFDWSFEDGELCVYVYTKPTPGRAQTIDQGSFTLRFCAAGENAIRVKVAHFEGTKKRPPEFTLCTDAHNFPVEVKEQEDSLVFSRGKLCAIIHKNPFSLAYFFDGRKLTESSPKALANITTPAGEVFMREQLSLSVGECVYGLGERFTAFVKNGQVVDMWNEDGGTASELAYKNVPFYVTSAGYGIFVLHPERVSFEVASENVERVQFSLPGQQLEYVIIAGGSTKDVVCTYTTLTGKPALPPAWSFGLWLTTSFTTSYDEQTVSSFINGMKERRIPLHVFHFDSFWMKATEWCNFTWDPETFPEPKAMLSRLKARGLKICVWINPYIAQKSPLFKEAQKSGFLLKKPNGDVWQWDRWQAGMGIVDFTNPDARKWYQDKLKKLLDDGVDCFKTDFGERIPCDVVYFDGSDPLKMHNYYTYLYNRCVFDLLLRERGKGQAVLFARSATAGSQKFPVHWGGDCWGTYESMAESLRGGLSLCMSGFGFWSHDISGFETTATPDLYKRWVAFGLLSTHSRLHGSSSYRVPWLFDDEAVDVLRFFTNLRCSLMPYLWAQAVETSRTGCPMMRAMALEFAESACKYLDTQYMLGESLLVAPIFNEQGTAEFYLPDGTWTDWFTGESVVGGKWHKKSCDYFCLPLFQRGSSIVATGSSNEQVEYDYAASPVFRISPVPDGKTAAADIFNTQGVLKASVRVLRTGCKLEVSLRGVTECTLDFFGTDGNLSWGNRGLIAKGKLGESVLQLEGLNPQGETIELQLG